MSERHDSGPETGTEAPDRARRDFLRRCGKYAVATPPAVAMMLQAADKPAEARSLYGSKRTYENNLQSWFKKLTSR